MRKSSIISLSAILLCAGAAAASDPATYVATPKGTVVVTPYAEGIFRVSRIPADADGVTFQKSQSAVMAPSAEGVKVTRTPDEVLLKSTTTTVAVNRHNGLVTFLTASGDTIISESGGVDNSGMKKRVSLRQHGEQNFYGAGERGHSLRLNGDSLVMFNRQNYGYGAGDPRINQMNITMPWVLSDKGYGILFDDYNAAAMHLGDKEIVYESVTPKPLSYYLVNGGTMPGVTDLYTELTGRQQLPPFWALGYITSRYGYHDEQETLGAIDSLKQRGYPVDGIVLDLFWYGKETDMGRLEWSKKQFPDPQKMLDSLRHQGVQTVLINQPYINKIGAIDNYNTLTAAGLLTHDSLGNPHDVTTWVGEAGMFDMSNPKTREWLWNRLKGLTTPGIGGWWGDLGEPEVHPLTIVHANGETASQYHNVYGNVWSETIYNGLRKDFPEMRPLLLMRGGTAGLQRYSVFPWSTDVARSWEGFRPQVAIMLNSGLSGLGYMSSDVGGFAVDNENPFLPELYLRWVQMGTFTPILRTHAQYKPEPYNYPMYEGILKDFIKQRYEWLPYNYTLAYENTTKGLPLARPLNFYGNQDKEADNITDEYLWGSEVLIAPVFQENARKRSVYFPAGSVWYNWNNPLKRYEGGTTAVVDAPLTVLPMFVKAGAFIPQYMKPIANTGEYNPDALTVKYFPSGEASEYTLFEDDRKSPASIADDAYQLITFKTEGRSAAGQTIEISTKGHYKGQPKTRLFTFELEAYGPVKEITANGQRLYPVSTPKALRNAGWFYDADKRTIILTVAYDYRPLRLEIK